jgi:hypothetical protein
VRDLNFRTLKSPNSGSGNEMFLRVVKCGFLENHHFSSRENEVEKVEILRKDAKSQT